MGFTLVLGKNTVLVRDAIRGIAGDRDVVRSGEFSSVEQVKSFALRPTVMPAVRVLRGIEGFTRYSTLPKVFAGCADLIVVAENTSHDVRTKFSNSMKKAATEVVVCAVPRWWGEEPARYLDFRADANEVTLSGWAKERVFASAGIDPWRIEMELLKLALLGDETKADEVLYSSPDRSLDYGSLVRGRVFAFMKSAQGIASGLELFWAVVTYVLNLMRYREVHQEKGTLVPELGPALARRYEADLGRVTAWEETCLLRVLGGVLDAVKDTGSRSLVFGALLEWNQERQAIKSTESLG